MNVLAQSSSSGGASALPLLILMAIAFVAYWLPSFVAVRRDHPSKGAVIVLNLLAGWTMLGWIGALVWASSNPGGRAPKRSKGWDALPEQPPAGRTTF